MSRYGQTIRPIVYNGSNDYSESMVSGERFESKDKFMILSSKSIPKSHRIYMEFTIMTHPTNNIIRHIPLYIGVSKEPSYGFLLSDFCMGSIYYCNKYYFSYTPDYTYPLDLQYVERYNQNANETVTKVTSKLKGKIPQINTVIGIAVDMLSNKISIYSDGGLLYSFSPKAFNMNTEPDDFFFCILCPLSDEHMIGHVNYGRISLKYKPDDYWSLYEYYYDKKMTYRNIEGTVYFGNRYTNPIIQKDFNAKISMTTPLAPVPTNRERIPTLVLAQNSTYYVADNSLTIVAGQTCMASISYPCPVEQKVYFEMNCKECELAMNQSTGLFDIAGIPLQIGIYKGSIYTGDPDLLTQNRDTFWINLFHQKHTKYDSYYTLSSTTVNGSYQITPLLPLVPTQPDSIGFIFDLKNGKISIITNGDIFAEVDIQGLSFDEMDTTYIFIRSDTSAYTASGYCTCSFGKEDLNFNYIVDNKDVMSYYYYYNMGIKDYMNYYIYCYIETRSNKTNYNKFISATLYVPEVATSDEWTPGINKIWNTYTKVSDGQTHNNEKTLSSDYIYNQLIDEETINVR